MPSTAELSFAGFMLPTPTTELAAVVENMISLQDVYEFQGIEWSGINTHNIPFATNLKEQRIKLGQLYWPRGASRWAIGHYVVNSASLHLIRQALNPSLSQANNPGLLVMDDDIGHIETYMYMLPARPLFQYPGFKQQSPTPNGDIAEDLYLLTLVDERYYWWYKAADFQIDPGVTTWDDLYGYIASALGITINVDTVDPAYLTPSPDLERHYRYAPLLLDGVASSVGQRIVRSWEDGSVTAQNYATSKTIYTANWIKNYPRYAGGEFAFDPTKRNDLFALVPNSITVVFPRSDDGSPTNNFYTIQTTLGSLALPEFQGITSGFAGDKKIFANAFADFALPGDPTPSNDTELQALAMQTSKDWYLWRLGAKDEKFAALRAWSSEGLNDHIEWIYQYGKESSTRVQRPEWNDAAEDIHNEGSAGSNNEDTDYYQWIQYNGFTEPQQIIFNFTGAGVTVTDDAANNRTNIDIPGAPAEPGTALTVEEVDGDPSCTDITKLQFHQGDGFVVTCVSAGVARVRMQCPKWVLYVGTYGPTEFYYFPIDTIGFNSNIFVIDGSLASQGACNLQGIALDLKYQMSITADTNGLKFVNDVFAPGSFYVYGTDAGGTKGWYPFGNFIISTQGIKIQDEFVDVTPQRRIINFIGNRVRAADDPGNQSTDVFVRVPYEAKGADFAVNIDEEIVYLVSLFGNDVTATLPTSDFDKAIVHFKVTSVYPSSNPPPYKLTIDGGSNNIDGETTQTLRYLDEWITLYGTNSVSGEDIIWSWRILNRSDTILDETAALASRRGVWNFKGPRVRAADEPTEKRSDIIVTVPFSIKTVDFTADEFQETFYLISGANDVTVTLPTPTTDMIGLIHYITNGLAALDKKVTITGTGVFFILRRDHDFTSADAQGHAWCKVYCDGTGWNLMANHGIDTIYSNGSMTIRNYQTLNIANGLSASDDFANGWTKAILDIHTLTQTKACPKEADEFALADSQDSYKTKKATLASLFDQACGTVGTQVVVTDVQCTNGTLYVATACMRWPAIINITFTPSTPCA